MATPEPTLGPRDCLTFRFPAGPLRTFTEVIGGQEFNFQAKGSTVLDVSPKSGRAPLFATRAKYRADSAPVREVARFVAARPILLGVPQR